MKRTPGYLRLLFGVVLCCIVCATCLAQKQDDTIDRDIERMVREGMVEALHSRFEGGRTPEQLRLLALAQTNAAIRTRDESARQEAFKDAEARYRAWIAVVEQDRDLDRVLRKVYAAEARVACAGMILSQWATGDLDEFEITNGRRCDTERLIILLLKTLHLLDQAGQTLAPLADELLEARTQRNEEIEEQYLIAGIFDTVPRLRLDVRFNRAWTNLYLGMTSRKNISQRSEALRAAERDFLDLLDSEQSGETGFRCRLGLAMTFREQARYEESRRLFEALSQDTQDATLLARTRYESARGEVNCGRFDEARIMLRQLLEKNPDRLTPADRPARFYINLAHLWEAVSYLREADLLSETADKSAAYQAISAKSKRQREAGLLRMNRLMARGGSWPGLVELFVTEVLDVPQGDLDSLGAAELLFIARRQMKSHEYERAEVILRAVSERQNVPDELAIDVLFELGVCHYRRDETRSAAEVFYRLSIDHATHPKAIKAVTYAYQLWVALAEQSKQREDYLKLADVLLYLVRTFPEHPQRDEATWWLPVALQAGGRYTDAGSHFGSVPESSDHYEEAQYRRVICLRLAYESEADNSTQVVAQELRARAIAVARELATYAQQAYQRKDTNRDPSSLRDWSAAALVSAAELFVADLVGQNQQALDLLAGFEQRYDDRRQIGRVLAVRITAYRAMRQYDRAAQVVEQFLAALDPGQAGGTLAAIARGMREEVERLWAEGDASTAASVAAQSIPIFEQLLVWTQAEPDRAGYLEAVLYGLARMCYVAEQFTPGRETIARLLELSPNNGNYQQLNALILTSTALRENTAPNMLVARKAWGVILRDPELRVRAPERFWEARYNYLELMFLEGKAGEVENAIRQDRIWYPDSDKSQWDQKIDDLYKRARESVDSSQHGNLSP